MKIGIDLGGSHIAIGVIDDYGNIKEKIERRILEDNKKQIKKIIEEYIISNYIELSKKYNIIEIGIAVPGTVTDIIVKSVNLNLENYDIVGGLNKIIKIPIKIRNDAKCAALAENKYGSLKEYDRSIFLTLGTGIGGAVVINNKLLDTGKLPGCEFGHMTIEKNGLECNCGKKGCFEKYCSMKVLKNNLRDSLKLDKNTRGQELLEIIRNNVPGNNNYDIIEKVISEFIENLSIGISNIVNIFEPEIIGIGGSFIYFEDVLLPRLKKNIQDKKYLFNKRDELLIVSAKLGNDAGIIGSIL